MLRANAKDTSNDIRYVKQIKADTKDFYCTVGEEGVYSRYI